MRHQLLFGIFFSILFMLEISCQQNNYSQTAAATLPELLQRKDAVMQGKEWDEVQNFYAKNLNRVRKNPQDQEALLNLSEAFIQEARVTGETAHYWPAALDVLDRVLKNNLRDKTIQFRALANKASVLLSMHQFAMALETGKQAVALNPYNAQVYGILVDANVELGHYKEAVETADKMVSIRPDLRSYSRVSYLRQIYGDNKGAIDAMNLATEAGYPGMENTEWARVNLGDILLNTGDLEDAKGVYQTALANRPKYPYAEIGLAKVAKAEGKYDEAIKYTEDAIRVIGQSAFVDLLADLYELKGDKQKATKIRRDVVRLLEEAQQEESKDAPVKHNGARELAMAYMKDNQLDKALDYALTDLKMRPDNIDANGLVAWIYYLKEDFANAKIHADKMLVTHVKNPDVLYKAGLIYAKAGDIAKGDQLLTDAKSISPYIDGLLTKGDITMLN